MSEYLLAVYLWSGVAAVGVASPLAYKLVEETLKAVGLCRNDTGEPEAPPPSLTSVPSTPGV